MTSTTSAIISNTEEYRKLIAARNNFLNFIGQDAIINLIRGIIQEAPSFSFRSAKAKQFINPINPLFILQTDSTQLLEAPTEEIYVDRLTELLEEEVCSLVNIEVSKYAKEFLATEKAQFLSESEGEFITHNTFSIIGNQVDNIIYLRLLTF